jgi:D-beta-D-heptose 7-phosphate kinase/D-beta-D-heptose 1-phosphate adenosyltransferase
MSSPLIDLVEAKESPRILVLGDLLLDRAWSGHAEWISQEAPVSGLRDDQQPIRLGGAALVAQLLRGLQVRVTLAGTVGTDRDGEELLQKLQSEGVNCSCVLRDCLRSTPGMPPLIEQAQRGCLAQKWPRVREARGPLDAIPITQLLDRMISQISQHAAILISDHAEGVCTPEVLQRVMLVARDARVPVIVDPAPSDDYARYAGAAGMILNRTASNLPFRSTSEAFENGENLVQQLGLEQIFVPFDTGIAIVRKDGSREEFPIQQREMGVNIGAGEKLLALIGLGVAIGWSDQAVAQLWGGISLEQSPPMPFPAADSAIRRAG